MSTVKSAGEMLLEDDCCEDVPSQSVIGRPGLFEGDLPRRDRGADLVGRALSVNSRPFDT